jgi:hypothetical protein
MEKKFQKKFPKNISPKKFQKMFPKIKFMLALTHVIEGGPHAKIWGLDPQVWEE